MFGSGIPLDFGGDLNSSDSSKWFDRYCRRDAGGTNIAGSNASAKSQANAASAVKSETFSNTQIQALALQFLPAANVEAWRACMLQKVSNQNVPRIAMTSSRNGATITVKLDWHPDSVRHDPPIVTDFWTDGADCENPPARNQPLTASSLILCRAKANAAVTIALNTDQGSAGPIEIPPPPLAGSTQPRCLRRLGPSNFYGDGCGDIYELRGPVMLINFGNGNSTTIPQPANAAYNASLGFWLVGDFNGDGLTDMIHFVTHNPGHENYAHVHFSRGQGKFDPPSAPFSFPSHSSPDYNASLGTWQARDVNGDGKDDLVHYTQINNNRVHVWLSNGDGTFSIQP
jgi:FG-GAP-like repeat